MVSVRKGRRYYASDAERTHLMRHYKVEPAQTNSHLDTRRDLKGGRLRRSELNRRSTTDKISELSGWRTLLDWQVAYYTVDFERSDQYSVFGC